MPARYLSLMKAPRQDPPSQTERKDRLKAALKANIARRKAQARAREDAPEETAPEKDEE